jgi:hypothetical protein
MTPIVMTAKVNVDGILHLDLPVGVAEAGNEVQITVESLAPGRMSQEQWQAFIQRTAGSIIDPEFRRWEQT